MNKPGKQIIDLLGRIKGNGSFVTSDTSPFIFPQLEVTGLGELSYPVNEQQAMDLIQLADKAPFGKGTETIYDDNVRSAWEIDAGKLLFKGSNWEQFLKSVMEVIKPRMGIENYKITTRLYKMLIYEKGDFFLWHKDTEKEKGMFATLIIGLPSKHTGGELIFRFDGEEQMVSFAGPASNYKIPFTAFYADCDHEVKPLTSGYRICLVYNLVQLKEGNPLQLEPLNKHVDNLSEILVRKESREQLSPGVVLLGHQYTPENFSRESLKLDDRTKAEAFLRAADKSGYYAKLCLVTSYAIGIPEDYGYGYKGDVDENAEMEEVHDEWIEIEHWSGDGIPPLRGLIIEEDDLLSSFNFGDEKPIKRELGGYMANYGPELSFWYHYGAVIFWPKDNHAGLLITRDVENRLEWLSYYNQNRQQLTEAENSICEFIVNSDLTSDSDKKINYDPVIDWLTGYDEEACFEKTGYRFLQEYFQEITPGQWIRLFYAYAVAHFNKIFHKVKQKADVDVISHMIIVLESLPDTPEIKGFVQAQVQTLPENFRRIKQKLKKKQWPVTSHSLKALLTLEYNFPQSEEWVCSIASSITISDSREYVNDVLSLTLTNLKKNTPLSGVLLSFCRENLQSRVNNKPQPPADWSRPIPDKPGEKRYWDLLAGFLKFPDQQVFDYRKVQYERKDLEMIIRHTRIDLRTETIKKGSPHILRIIKTQAGYEKNLKDWSKDEVLLRKVIQRSENEK